MTEMLTYFYDVFYSLLPTISADYGTDTASLGFVAYIFVGIGFLLCLVAVLGLVLLGFSRLVAWLWGVDDGFMCWLSHAFQRCGCVLLWAGVWRLVRLLRSSRAS